MKRKNNDIKYHFRTAPGLVEEFTTDFLFELWTDRTASKSSKWWNDLTLTPSGTTNRALQHVMAMKRSLANTEKPPERPRPATSIRACPPIGELLQRSLVITAPCDIHFASVSSHDYIDMVMKSHSRDYPPEEHWIVKFADPRFNETYSGMHFPPQYESENTTTFRNMTNVKIETGLTLSLPDGWHSMLMSPFFHNPDVPWQQIPGVHTGRLAGSVNLIWNVMVPRMVKSFEIKAGEAMMYVLFSDRPRRFVYSENAKKGSILKRHTFSAGEGAGYLEDRLAKKKKKQ